MKCLMIPVFLVFYGCTGMGIGFRAETFIDYTLWTMHKEKVVSDMNYTIAPRTGYYIQKGKPDGKFPNFFILFSDGYFAFSSPGSTSMLTPQAFSRYGVDWGRFVVNLDSIQIQYFRNTSLGSADGFLTFRQDLAVVSATGSVVNDSTILMHYRKSWCSVCIPEIKQGFSYMMFDPPIEYDYLPCDSMPSSENWIKHLDYSKNSLE